AELMRSGSPAERLDAATRINNFFSYLLPPEILDNLPRNPARWGEDDHARVIETLRKTSCGDEFESMLAVHIRAHFPDLIIPTVVDDFITAAGQEAAAWAEQTASAELRGSEEGYAAEVARIESVRADLLAIREEGERRLLDPFRAIREELHARPDSV